MDLSPWAYWTKDGQATAYTGEIVSTLESALPRAPDHIGANPFYIHAVEASQAPERALPSAERLERLSPGAEHLVHMPGHVYWRVGRYADAVRVNERAIGVDEETLRRGVTGADRGSHTYYAEAVYREDLRQYPNNGWSLFGLARSLRAQGKLAEADEAQRRFDEAWQRADVTLSASRF